MSKRISILALMALLVFATESCKKKDKTPENNQRQNTDQGTTSESNESEKESSDDSANTATATASAPNAAQPAATPPEPKADGPLKSDFGVDLAKKVITIGALNDESGPAAVIGKPYASGKRLLVRQVNAGGSGFLPDGWSLQLVERDHGYNPQKSVQAFNEIKDDVLFIGTSFGTPNTLPLRDALTRDGLVAFPASLSSKMAEHTYTPPAGPSYEIEAMGAMDFIVKLAKDASAVKAAVIYQQDDYGLDGLKGFKRAAATHGVSIVAEQTVVPGQKDFVAVVSALKDKGATHILLVVLPSATGLILGTAAQMKYMPVWVGATPTWIDPFFSPKVIPSAVFSRFYWMSSLPVWGEPVPGMDTFVQAFQKHGADLGRPDFYLLVSYLQGRIELEAARVAIEAGDITRKGYLKALQGLSEWNADGMMQSVDLTSNPYVTGTKVRVLRPIFDKTTWTVASGYATPKTIAK
ncbi:MAG: hypothetical protein CMH54_11245 [Myxococcales bacterium]|nr:hypothetical protein [Myxococcales bacterium]